MDDSPPVDAPPRLANPPAGRATTGTFSTTELVTLASIAETFVRGGAHRRAALAAEALTAAADPAQVRQLRLALRAMESRIANLLLVGRPVPFRDMAPAVRERYLLGWGTSRLPLRRTAFHGLRKLLTFLAYADPGETPSAPNPRLEAIGYRPDRPEPTADPTPIRPFVLPAARHPGQPVVIDADVVVVGSGSGGGVIARDLAVAGRDVVVLEAGPFVDEASMPTNELDAFDRLYLNHGIVTTWDGSVTLLSGTGVGGGTVVNWMTCIDSPAHVRGTWARAHGLDGWDAPSAEADVEAIEAELGVCETAELPPKDRAIVRGATALGWEVGPTRRNAPGCTTCGSCPFGCRAGAKRSGLRTHLAEAFSAGARIVPDAAVSRVLVDGGAVSGAEASTTRGPLVVRARQVVVAAGALRTPAILERSLIRHPALGRYLRVHPVPVAAGRFDEPVEMWRGASQGARVAQFLWPEATRTTYVIESAPGHPGLFSLAVPWEGTDAHEAMLRRARFFAPLVAVTQDGGQGRVSLTRAGRVRLDYRLDATGVATMRHALVAMARLARAAGAREILAVGTVPRWYGRDGHQSGGEARAFAAFERELATFDYAPNRGTVFSAHQMGTARMGADPRTHVCDPAGRVRASQRSGRAIRGLYVGDASLFPTAIGVNPMITVMALARRVARTVLAEG